MDYNNYKVEDFVLDHEFRNWVLNPNAGSNIFWETWIAEHPDKLWAIKDAREILLSLGRVHYTPTDEMENELWSRIDLDTADLSSEERDIVPLSPSSIIDRYSEQKSRSFKWVYSGIAASFILAVSILGYIEFVDFNAFEEVAKVEVFTKENSKGQKSNILLPDGTRVLLNAESTIEYTSDYNDTQRKINLQGEAFFEVAKDLKRPFIVETKSLSSTALGTSFNVSAYAGEKTEVVLFTGKLKVESATDTTSSVILTPGEKVRLTQRDNLVKNQADLSNEALWKDGILYFSDTPMKLVLNDLERWYGVEMKVENLIRADLLFTGKFENENLRNVLQSISYTTGFTYQIEDKKVTIKF